MVQMLAGEDGLVLVMMILIYGDDIDCDDDGNNFF